MPEYIEKFFLEAYRSFGGTITPVKDRKGVWSIGRVPPDLRKLSESLERKYGKVGTSYPLLTFDKELLVGYSDLQFVGPGHPLFEGVADRVLRDYGPSLASRSRVLQCRFLRTDCALVAQMRRSRMVEGT